MSGCYTGIIADGHFVCTRIPVGIHYSINTLCLGYDIMMCSMAAYLEGTGLDYRMIGICFLFSIQSTAFFGSFAKDKS